MQYSNSDHCFYYMQFCRQYTFKIFIIALSRAIYIVYIPYCTRYCTFYSFPSECVYCISDSGATLWLDGAIPLTDLYHRLF